MRKERLLNVLLAPHLSEKSAGQYIFRVAKCADKTEIKKAVEALFQVNVKSVNVVNVKSSVKNRLSRGPGRQTTWKKAYVVLQAGQEINIA